MACSLNMGSCATGVDQPILESLHNMYDLRNHLIEAGQEDESEKMVTAWHMALSTALKA